MTNDRAESLDPMVGSPRVALAGGDALTPYLVDAPESLRAVHLFAFSRETRQSLVEDYGVPAEWVTTVGPGVNVTSMPPVIDRSNGAEPTILFLGNDSVRKGGDVLLQAFIRVRAVLPSRHGRCRCHRSSARSAADCRPQFARRRFRPTLDIRSVPPGAAGGDGLAGYPSSRPAALAPPRSLTTR